MNREEAIKKVKECLGLIPLSNSHFVYIKEQAIGMPTSPNALKEAERLIKEHKIKSIIDKELILEGLK